MISNKDIIYIFVETDKDTDTRTFLSVILPTRLSIPLKFAQWGHHAFMSKRYLGEYALNSRFSCESCSDHSVRVEVNGWFTYLHARLRRK